MVGHSWLVIGSTQGTRDQRGSGGGSGGGTVITVVMVVVIGGSWQSGGEWVVQIGSSSFVGTGRRGLLR